MSVLAEQSSWQPLDDYDLAFHASSSPSLRERMVHFLSTCDVGGLKLQYVTRAILAGWLAFLVRMFFRPPFFNVMFFCVVMFTLFSLSNGKFRLRDVLLTAVGFYVFTGIGFFSMAVTYQFPTLQFLTLIVYTFVLMSFCRVRLMAVLSIAYTSIGVYSFPGWYEGINCCFALGVCFLCTVCAVWVFPSSYRAVEKTCVLKYLDRLRDMFRRMTKGWQPETFELADYIREIVSLSSLVLDLTSRSGEGIDCLANLPSLARKRFVALRAFSRGLVLLRGFRRVKDDFIGDFPAFAEFVKDVEEAFRGIEAEILTDVPYCGPKTEKFAFWRVYFEEKRESEACGRYAYAFSNLAKDLALVIAPPDEFGVLPERCYERFFFSVNTRMWEAARFTISIAIAYIFVRMTRIPHAEWTGMFVAFMYVVPQHGIVLQRIGKGIMGTCLGIMLGFVMIETTMQYSYLWAYAFPLVGLIMLYIFALRNDFAVMMLAFACALMFSVIMSAPVGSDPNLYQALASRQAMALTAGVIVFLVELATFFFGSLSHDIRYHASKVFETMADTLEFHSELLAKGVVGKLHSLDEIYNILSGDGTISAMREMIEFEIGFNPRLQKYYDEFTKHLNVCCLYQRKMYYLTNHPGTKLEESHIVAIRKAVKSILKALRESSEFIWDTENVRGKVEEELAAIPKEKIPPQLYYYAETVALFAKNLDETRFNASKIMTLPCRK